ncbi:Macro domain, possibly ADP-ribose binding module [Planococcus halocryophilus Or1]|uniref:RNase III inhibitor n=1 Tax=Planococcus halocryophilus TaxID=1215089 RepID=A0A1C7DP85_9BACL|nr:Rnase II inhibitor [Planococcus halocryophilus]ANU13178.1 RNase III inhibitor [Planococcus halocryophilus]EMF46848.1 Macro domain, possibly ADP-ribose binding module [Planococcus halocryophilus Or1]
MPFEIVRNDITKMKTDAIVNAANASLKMGGGVCGAIFSAAGSHALQEACDQIGHCAVGSAVQTEAFSLDANYIVHTVGPVWQGGENHEEQLLRNCYENSLELAHQLGCKSISFPLISTGIFGYPKEPALQIAVSTIEKFLMTHEMHVYLVVFDKKSFGISEKRYRSIATFIDENEVRTLEEHDIRYRKKGDSELVFHSPDIELSLESQIDLSLDDMLGNMDESFSERLLRFIDEKDMTDIETYKKANIDRKLFSKIRNSANYTPMKKTIIAFAVALELDLIETEDLLEKAGYRLSRSHKFDLIILYFIERENYNIHEINEALFAFDQVLLGG